MPEAEKRFFCFSFFYAAIKAFFIWQAVFNELGIKFMHPFVIK
jgi:hypothetical protein